jgi:transposase
MFSLNESIRYYLYPYPTDMRKSFYTLSGIVNNLMGLNVSAGDAFIFMNRHLDTIKILHMETGGLVIYHMKLEAGRFRLPDIDIATKNNAHATSWTELSLMVQGLSLSGSCHQKRWNPKEKQQK